ncbi:YlbF family regulator [Atribacter laminatus]|jgi:cell fate (sporulation/competence/biofilm development) regulator YlbF (YheA/YmcA/DUF963 family)|uniref:YlbF family regulator n=1 Tax=Atribacter laminatus TaxID=2847778 RepID=A0A7T1AJS2_ATRLM|nr:YlbF family regulator [Atribacter laminatus]QPM67213.1 hypothetical protein RT761_00405 [Atribacter laminatus]
MSSLLLNEDLKNVSRKFAEEIMQTTVFKKFQITRSAILGDEAASSIMNLLRDEQERLLEISCERDIEENDFAELNNLHEKANNNQLIRSYLEAEKSLFQLTQALNTEITSLIGFDFALSVMHRDDDNEEAAWE